MQPQRETIHLSQSLRDVALAPLAQGGGNGPDAGESERAGYDRGRLEGEQLLREQLVQQRADLATLQNGLLASLRKTLPEIARDCEQMLIQLALETARKLVGGLPVSPEMVEAGVREALAQAHESAELHIQLHPEDLALLQRVNSPLLADGEGKLKFHSSAEVTRGGCLVRTRFGVIDARQETKFELLKKSLQA